MNDFVWVDLSTYNLKLSKGFYESVFGWSFVGTDGYLVGQSEGGDVAGLFDMPPYFRKIKMPHFWMSYVAVKDTRKTIELVKEFEGAKIEVVDDFYDGAIALIRDPQGAGFTIYDGGNLNAKKSRFGHLVWNELHVSRPEKVVPFYRRIFDWTFCMNSRQSYRVSNGNGHQIADLWVVPDEIKGKHEYWVCTFGVKDLEQSRLLVEQNGGSVVVKEKDRLLVCDNSNEAFFYIRELADLVE